MWNAIAILNGERVVIASGLYVEMLDATRQWLSEQGDIWFEMPAKPANLLSTAEMEELGIEFVEIKYKFATREYDRVSGEFKDAVTTGYDQILEAIGLEEAKTDYIHWLASQGYFEDHGIPEGREEEAVLGYPVEE